MGPNLTPSTTTDDVKRAAGLIADGNTPGENPWPNRIATFDKYAQPFHQRGEQIERRYEDERDANDSISSGGLGGVTGGKKVNMFFSNTSVIKESLFNSLPKPDVSRLHNGDWDNDVARVAALIVQRGLTYEINNAPHFQCAVEAAILDRLVPGIGTSWVDFHPADPATGAPEYLSVDVVYWKDLLWQPHRTWEQSDWVGRRIMVDTAEAKKRWGDAAVVEDDGKNQNASGGTAEAAMREGKVCVIQMWDRVTKTVQWLNKSGQKLGEATPDPYKLRKFFPTPRPLIANPPTRKFLPLPDYYMAQDQYMELDVIYIRINLIIEAVRVAGVYDAAQPAIGRMLGGAENRLIPVDGWAMFAERGGLKGAIDWFPVETVTTVLQQLIGTYEFVKGQLFEVTGMADIVRGNSNQYETLGAQQIKAQFASVRLNGYQRNVSCFVRDLLRIMAELQVQLYSDERLAQVCGQLPQQDMQLVPQAIALLRNDFLAQCAVNIQADSLTQADWGLQAEQRMGYVQALSGFITSALPVAQSSPALAPLLMSIMKFASVGFKGSAELEGILDNTLDQMQAMANQPPPPSPEQQKAQADMQAKQAEMQMQQEKNAQELQLKQQENQMKLQQMQQEFALKMRELEAELAMQANEHQMKMSQMQEEHTLRMQQSREQTELKLATDAATSAAKVESTRAVEGEKAKWWSRKSTKSEKGNDRE